MLLKDDLPRGMWRLGEIIQLVHSRDGEIRSAKVQTSSGKVLNRPLNLLYPLEVDRDVTNNNEVKNSVTETQRPTRKAAEIAKRNIKELYNS